MDPARSRAGTGLLRDYLQYVASGGAVFGDGRASPVSLNPFEADVADTLQAAGIPVVPQWGASQYRIDLVARHPERPGQFVLAIECDGASYHSAATARDRDRLRQQHLEALGWRFHRIWSTDWFLRREEEIRRALDAYKAAVAHADRSDAQAPAAPNVSGANRNWTAVAGDSRSHPRGPKPGIVPGQPIDAYSDIELVVLVQWVKSDGRLR